MDISEKIVWLVTYLALFFLTTLCSLPYALGYRGDGDISATIFLLVVVGLTTIYWIFRLVYLAGRRSK